MPAEQFSTTGHESIAEDTSQGNAITLQRLVELARDPTLIPGVHERCDQWCMYCPITNRCLAFRSTEGGEENRLWEPSTPSEDEVDEGMLFLKQLADAQGRLAPPEIEAVVSRDRERIRKIFMLDDPLERIGRSCMTLAHAYLQSRADFPHPIVWRPEGPTPLDILTWYHVLTAARVFRAILCGEEARGGVAGRHRDALAAAAVALNGVDRSLTAIATMRTHDDDDPRLALLQSELRRLRTGVEQRFPGARGFSGCNFEEEPADTGWLRRCVRRVYVRFHPARRGTR